MPWLTGTAFLHSVMIQEKRGMLKVWNVSLVLATGVLADPRHVPGALGHPRLDPRLRRVHARRAVPGPDRGDDRRVDLRSSPRAPTRAAVRPPAGLAAVARGDVPAQQPRARAAVRGDLVGHVLPAASRRRSPATGRRSARRGSTGFTVPLALVLVLLSGIGPLIAWRRATAANLRRNFTVPIAIAAAARGARPALVGRRLAAGRADHVRARRLRARRRRAGAVPRHARAAA